MITNSFANLPLPFQFVTDNLTMYTIERSQCSTAVDGGCIKVQSVFVDFKHIVSEVSSMAKNVDIILMSISLQAKDRGFEVPKGFYGEYYSMCTGLSKMGLLSNEGRKKTVVGVKETRLAVEALVKSQSGDLSYNLQVSALLLIILYSGIRLSSVMPKERCLEGEQKYLRWKVSSPYILIQDFTYLHAILLQDVQIYRQGRDKMGDQITVKITFPHVKCKDNVLNNADHEFTRTFTSSVDQYTDLPSILVSLLVSRDFLKEDFHEWYLGGKMILEVKQEVLELPVFCRNEMGGQV